MAHPIISAAVALAAVPLLLQQASAQDALVTFLPKADLGQFVASELDLATIQSSLNPRRGVHQDHFSDLGLTVSEASEDRAVLDGPYEIFVVQIVERGDQNKDGIEDLVICVSDSSKEGSYSASTPYVVQKYSETTPLLALAWRPPRRAREMCGGTN